MIVIVVVLVKNVSKSNTNDIDNSDNHEDSK